MLFEWFSDIRQDGIQLSVANIRTYNIELQSKNFHKFIYDRLYFNGGVPSIVYYLGLDLYYTSHLMLIAHQYPHSIRKYDPN